MEVFKRLLILISISICAVSGGMALFEWKEYEANIELYEYWQREQDRSAEYSETNNIAFNTKMSFLAAAARSERRLTNWCYVFLASLPIAGLLWISTSWILMGKIPFRSK